MYDCEIGESRYDLMREYAKEKLLEAINEELALIFDAEKHQIANNIDYGESCLSA